jgi:hypothetical protein
MANEITVTPNEVRALIDPQMDAGSLPDARIELNVFMGAAIAEVARRDPKHADREGDAAEALNRAADCLTAALLVEAFPNITLIQPDASVKYQREAYDVNERIAYLRNRANAEFAVVLGDGTATEDMPTMFSLGCGRRGR